MHDEQHTTVRPATPNNNQCKTPSDQSLHIHNDTHTSSSRTSVATSTRTPQGHIHLPTVYEGHIPHITLENTITTVMLYTPFKPYQAESVTDNTKETPANETHVTKRPENGPRNSGCLTCSNHEQCPQGLCWAVNMTCYMCQTRGHLASRCTTTGEHPRSHSGTTRN